MGLGCYESKLNFHDTLTTSKSNSSVNSIPSSPENSVNGVLTSASLTYNAYQASFVNGIIQMPSGTIIVDNITIVGAFYERVNGIAESFAFIRIGTPYSVKFKPELSANINTYELEQIK
jgi:hypothetical protein